MFGSQTAGWVSAVVSLCLIIGCCHCKGNEWRDSSVSLGNGSLSLRVNSDGTYSVAVQGTTWFNSHDTFFTIGGKTYSQMNGTLHLVSGIETSKGYDAKLGAYSKGTLNWRADDDDHTEIITSFEIYDHTITFTQDFSKSGLTGTSVGDENNVCTGFPSFTLAKELAKSTGFMSYGHLFINDVATGSWSSSSKDVQGGLYGGPLAFFNESGSTIVMSAFNEFMASSVYYDPKSDAVTQGVMGKVKEIPKGYKLQTVIQFGTKLKETWFSWGELLQKTYGTKRWIDKDPSLKYLGFWTDNGAFYYYNMELGKNYEQTLLDVKEYANDNYIPYRYMQLDSWWYYKGLHGGVKNWTAEPIVFPDGLKSFQEQVGYQLHAHNRWWSSDTDYAMQNGGKYEFIVETGYAIPQDEQFWDYLFSSSKKWGLFLYEQDWLNVQFQVMNATLENITVGRTWLMGMNYGAEKNDMLLQFCMPMARHLLQSVEISPVTQARASGDYQPGNGQWDIGMTSIMHHALGIRPFKDNFWSTVKQPGNIYGKTEPHPALQATVAALSTGPVGPGDKIGYSNITLINRTCNSDGLLLKPSRPAMMIDISIINTALGSWKLSRQVWSTYSIVSGLVFGNLLSIDNLMSVELNTIDADLEMMTDPTYAFVDGSEKVWPFDSKNKISVGPSSVDYYQLWHVSPGMSFKNDTFVLMGEVSKIVAVSPDRFQSLSVNQTAISMVLNAGTRETIELMFWSAKRGSTFTVSCTSIKTGTMDITLTDYGHYSCSME